MRDVKKRLITLTSLHSMEISVPPSLLKSRLLLSNRDSGKLNRYEMTIAHQFYNALDRFMEYRRYRLTLGGSAESALANVEASSSASGGSPLLPGENGDPAPSPDDGTTPGTRRGASRCAHPEPERDARATSSHQSREREQAGGRGSGQDARATSSVEAKTDDDEPAPGND